MCLIAEPEPSLWGRGPDTLSEDGMGMAWVWKQVVILDTHLSALEERLCLTTSR